MWTLKRYDKTPPGGYPFTQTQGIHHEWGFSVDFDGRSKEISEFRTANNLLRSGIEESTVDLVQFTCQRLGGMGCINTEKTYAETVPKIAKLTRGCRGCGARV